MSTGNTGLNFFDTMTLILFTLKLIGEINVSWWIVALPILLPTLLGILIGIVAKIFFSPKKKTKKK